MSDTSTGVQAAPEAAPASPAGSPASPEVSTSPAPAGVTGSDPSKGGPPEAIPYSRFQESRQQLQQERQARLQLEQQYQQKLAALEAQVAQGPSADVIKQHLASMFAPEPAPDYSDPLEREVNELKQTLQQQQQQHAQLQQQLQQTAADNYRHGVLEPMMALAQEQFPHADRDEVVQLVTQELRKQPTMRHPTRQDFIQAAQVSQQRAFERAEAIMKARFPGMQLPHQLPTPPFNGQLAPGNPGVVPDVDTSKMDYSDIIAGSLGVRKTF